MRPVGVELGLLSVMVSLLIEQKLLGQMVIGDDGVVTSIFTLGNRKRVS